MYTQTVEWKNSMEEDLNIIRKNMEDENYKSIGEINTKNVQIQTSVDRLNDSLNTMRDNQDKIFNALYNDMGVLKNNINALGNDPNTISRY
jgi:predicted negative regulator of RcsB-dependent stress response